MSLNVFREESLLLTLCEQHSSSSRVVSVAGKTLEYKRVPPSHRTAAEGNVADELFSPLLANQKYWKCPVIAARWLNRTDTKLLIDFRQETPYITINNSERNFYLNGPTAFKELCNDSMTLSTIYISPVLRRNIIMAIYVYAVLIKLEREGSIFPRL